MKKRFVSLLLFTCVWWTGAEWERNLCETFEVSGRSNNGTESGYGCEAYPYFSAVGLAADGTSPEAKPAKVGLNEIGIRTTK